jgi:hypothetical protein
MRPTCGHIPTSPHCGLYEMPSLCVLPSTPRRPASGSVLSLAIRYRHVALRDPGKLFGCMHPVPLPMTLAFDPHGWSRHFPLPPPSDSRGEPISGLDYGSLSLRPVDLLAPLSELTRFSTQPTGTFTSGLPTVWSPSPPPDITTAATGQVPLAGLSPARTPTSIAATARFRSCSVMNT